MDPRPFVPYRARQVRSAVIAALAITALVAALLPAGATAMPGVSGDGAGNALQAVSAADVTTFTRFNTTEPVMSLTFDAGSDRGFTSQILDTLRDNNVRATFGMTGSWAQPNADLIQRMVREGHTLINHTWSHPSFTGRSTGTRALTTAERQDQLIRTENLIRSQAGVELRPFFRPPYGDYDTSVLADIAAIGYTVNVMWTVDTLGWNGLSASAIRQRVIDTAGPGAIVLMHVGAASQDAAALPGMIQDLRARGFRFATVHDFLGGRIGPDQRYFPETGQWLSHGFLRYWEHFGGLQVFGYPISGELRENGRTVQYLERARLEWHPGAWPERYDVLLGLLGVELTAGRQSEAPFQRVNAASDPNCTYYAQTGHRLCFGFRTFWEKNGGLATFGFPISEEFKENGVTVQYFERQRFEYHPEDRPPWDIVGGLLGNQRYAQLYPRP